MCIKKKKNKGCVVDARVSFLGGMLVPSGEMFVRSSVHVMQLPPLVSEPYIHKPGNAPRLSLRFPTISFSSAPPAKIPIFIPPSSAFSGAARHVFCLAARAEIRNLRNASRVMLELVAGQTCTGKA
jgi:hypothetical protein